MERLRVLITNIRLSTGSGTEKYVLDLATQLLRLGHLPMVFSTELGDLADRLQAVSIPVTSDLNTLTVAPDLIHGHHSLETMAAMLHFPGVPGIFVCHDCSAWHDAAPRFPRIYRYVAVDDACGERLMCEHGVEPAHVEVLFNGVDLSRFSRRSPLPPSPRRAIVVSNNMDHRDIRSLQQACASRQISLDLCGRKLGGSREPESVLSDYDLVFAKARCAWEGLATGAAVIVCDVAGVGGLVTSANLNELRRWNFGRRLLQRPLGRETVGAEIDRYDARDAAQVTTTIRETAGIDLLAEQFVSLYGEVIVEHRMRLSDPAAESRAAGQYLQWWAATRHDLIRRQAKRYRPTAILARLSRSVSRRLALKLRRLSSRDRFAAGSQHQPVRTSTTSRKAG